MRYYITIALVLVASSASAEEWSAIVPGQEASFLAAIHEAGIGTNGGPFNSGSIIVWKECAGDDDFGFKPATLLASFNPEINIDNVERFQFTVAIQARGTQYDIGFVIDHTWDGNPESHSWHMTQSVPGFYQAEVIYESYLRLWSFEGTSLFDPVANTVGTTSMLKARF